MNNNRPTIWIPQEPMHRENGRWVSKGFDLAATAEYGNMKIIWSPDTSVLQRGEIERDALAAAKQYDSTCDYVVALGSPTLIGMLGWALGTLDKPLRVLEWSKQMKRYYPTMTQKG